MMVSKVAVIALVAIISVPILLGYAMNLTEVTETDYRITGDSVNATPLLLNDIEFTYTHADIYQLNSNFNNGGAKKMMPLFEFRGSDRSALYLQKASYAGIPGSNYDLWLLDYGYMTITDSDDTNYLRMSIYYVDGGGEHSYGYVDKLIDWSYEDSTKTLNYSYILSSGGYSSVRTGSYTNDQIRLKFTNYGSYDYHTDGFYYFKLKTSDLTASNWVDFSAGFTLINHNQTVNQPYVWSTTPASSIVFPNGTKTALLTMDLDSITDSSYSMLMGNPLFYLNKTTTDGVVSWQIVDYYDPTYTIDLYYNQSGNNTYQLYFYSDPNGTPTGTPGYYTYDKHIEFRYVGNWPDLIGEATPYLTFTYDYQQVDDKYPDTGGIGFEGVNKTPIMRMDDAVFRAFEYQVLYNQTYDPAAFKSNPATKITNTELIGSSLEFGGHTYAVTKGNISLDGQDIPVNGLVLSSFDNGDGTYTNRIGNTVVSTTAAPSTITFNGSWLANISTQSIESYNYTKTQWIAGSFGWDGVDQNFLMVGLLTCLGVFVALGIYARKSRSGGIIPLMIVTGCAAAVFFIML